MTKKDLRKHRTFRLTDEGFDNIRWCAGHLARTRGERISHGRALELLAVIYREQVERLERENAS